MRLRCYCCGGAIGARVALVASGPDRAADRVFVMLPEHAARAADASVAVAVLEGDPAGPGGDDWGRLPKARTGP